MADDRAWSEEQTTDPLYADGRNFYKVELWTRDGQHIDRLLYAGNNLDRAQAELVGLREKAPAGSDFGPVSLDDLVGGSKQHGRDGNA